METDIITTVLAAVNTFITTFITAHFVGIITLLAGLGVVYALVRLAKRAPAKMFGGSN